MIFRDFSDFSIAGNNWKKKKFNYNEKRKKNWCRNLEISYCMICIVRLYCGEQWQRQGAGLGIRRAQRRWARQQARTGALGHRRACWGAGACGRALGARVWHGQARCRRADARASGRCAGRAGERQAHGRWRARARAGERQLGAGAGGRQGAGRAAGRRWARAAWAPGLALGSALGALGPFSIRFDSFFFLSHQMNTVHCEIKFFEKKIIYF